MPYQPTKPYNKRRSDQVKLNIACGPNVFPHEGWINLDKYDFASYFAYVSNPAVPLTGMPAHQQELATFLRDGGAFRFERQDMLDPFTQFADGSVDLIYVGQAIEHMSYTSQAPSFLKECLRMLKPGGVLRLTTPDLEALLTALSLEQMDLFDADQPECFKAQDQYTKFSMLLFGASGPDCTQENYQGHFHVYTKGSMERLLTAVGFGVVRLFPSRHPEIRDEGLSHSMVVEAVK